MLKTEGESASVKGVILSCDIFCVIAQKESCKSAQIFGIAVFM